MEKLFKYFTLDLPITNSYIGWFTKNFPVTEFTEVDKVLYLYLEYCALLSIKAKRNHLSVFLSTELKRLVRKHNIRIGALTANYNYDEIAAFEQAVQVISTVTVDKYDLYVSESVDDEDNFKVLLAEFMDTNLKERIMHIFTEQFARMNSGEDTIIIAEDTSNELRIVRGIYDLKKIANLDFIVGRNLSDSRAGNEEGARLISKTGIPAIDDDYGGVFSRALVTFAGQPGGGKTRFLCAVFIYPALVQYKVGVRVDSIELEVYEIENMLLSIHIANLYKIKIADREMNRKTLNAEQKKIKESARIDLFESGKYGRLFLQHKSLYVESLYDDMLMFLKLNRDIQIVCIDYIGRIESNPADKYSRLVGYEIIDKSLLAAKSVASITDTCFVCVNQYNDEGNKAAFAGKPITVGMIQGGQAVQKHSDIDFAITFTDDQEAANLRMISTTKKRAAVGFKYVPLQTDLAISRFTQINKIESRG